MAEHWSPFSPFLSFVSLQHRPLHSATVYTLKAAYRRVWARWGKRGARGRQGGGEGEQGVKAARGDTRRMRSAKCTAMREKLQVPVKIQSNIYITTCVALLSPPLLFL